MNVCRFDGIAAVQLNGIQVLRQLDEVQEVVVVAGASTTSDIADIGRARNRGEGNVVATHRHVLSRVASLHDPFGRCRPNEVEQHLGIEAHAVVIEGCTLLNEQALGLGQQDIHARSAQQRQ